jgi:hypothetical protein
VDTSFYEIVGELPSTAASPVLNHYAEKFQLCILTLEGLDTAVFQRINRHGDQHGINQEGFTLQGQQNKTFLVWFRYNSNFRYRHSE